MRDHPLMWCEMRERMLKNLITTPEIKTQNKFPKSKGQVLGEQTSTHKKTLIKNKLKPLRANLITSFSFHLKRISKAGLKTQPIETYRRPPLMTFLPPSMYTVPAVDFESDHKPAPADITSNKLKSRQV